MNCGFTIGESSQHVILMEDHLAVELGATIYGSVPTVASHADGGKRSISTPGAGNYLTVAQAAASVHDLLGKDVLAYETIVQAHGTSTPQNRVTNRMSYHELHEPSVSKVGLCARSKASLVTRKVPPVAIN